jgi:hypothetical protein
MGLAALLLLALGLPASDAPAQAPAAWVEFRRDPVRTWEYRVYARKPGGRVEILTRVHCRPGLTDTPGCMEAIGVGRLSDLRRRPPAVTSDKGLPEGRWPFWEIEGHVLDCGARTHRHVFREYYDEADALVTRADFKDSGWKVWEGALAAAGELACR